MTIHDAGVVQVGADGLVASMCCCCLERNKVLGEASYLAQLGRDVTVLALRRSEVSRGQLGSQCSLVFLRRVVPGRCSADFDVERRAARWLSATVRVVRCSQETEPTRQRGHRP